MAKLSGFVAGMIILCLIVSGFVIFISGGATTYSTYTSGMNTSGLDKTSAKLNDLYLTMNDTSEKLNAISSPEAGIIDKLGAFFGSAYEAVKLVGKTSDVSISMASEGIDMLPMGGFGDVVKVSLIMLILTFIFIYVMFHVLIKSDRT